MENKLTQEETNFCKLYINGTAPYAGNAAKCYKEVFKVDTMETKHLAKELLTKPGIRKYLEELEKLSHEDTKYMKKFLTENLIHIIEETSTSEYCDRRGVKLSPAALRSVAVNASKALMEMYPIKEAQVNKLNIEGAGEGGVVFNIIAPTLNHKTDSDNSQLSDD
jgi:hypothetical protein